MIRVKITDQEHPHYGETGELKSKQTVMNGRMLLVVLEDCRHMVNGCYADKKQFEVLESVTGVEG